jgi:alpha-glucoside transport system permease protein
LVILLIVIVWVIPTIGVLISSFRPAGLVNANGWWTVFTDFANNRWTFENYSTVLASEGFGNAFLNSLAVTIPSTVIPITIAAFAAYAFAWMEFPGRQWIFVSVVALLVVPLQMALIPLLSIYVDVGLNQTFPAVWLAHTGFGLPLAIYLLRNYIGSLPSSLMESAHIDGATHFEIFTKLVVPLSVPVLASFAIFQFLWVWNDLLVALVFLGGNPDVQVVTLALRDLNGSRGEAWHLLTAGAFITMALPLLVFLTLQRYFVRGLTAGSVKG